MPKSIKQVEGFENTLKGLIEWVDNKEEGETTNENIRELWALVSRDLRTAKESVARIVALQRK